MKIGILIGSVREQRNGAAVAKWTYEYALSRKDEGIDYELVDLKDYDLPFLGLTPTAAQGAAIKAWSEKIASLDAIVLVTPEYNHAMPGTLKNALDFLKPELADKVVGFVGYGGLGAARSIEHARNSLTTQDVATVNPTVNLSIITDFKNMSEFTPAAFHEGELKALFDKLIQWSKAFATIRA